MRDCKTKMIYEGAPENRDAFLFSPVRAHILTTSYAGGGPAFGSRALSEGDAASVEALTDFQSEKRLLLPGGSNRFPFSNPYAFTRARPKAWGREPRVTLDEERR